MFALLGRIPCSISAIPFIPACERRERLLSETTPNLTELDPEAYGLDEDETGVWNEYEELGARDIGDDIWSHLAALVDAGGADPQIESDLEAARVELQTAQDLADGIAAEKAAAEEYETLRLEVEALALEVDEQPLVQRSLLEAAANKPVTDAVEEAVKKLLGL